MGKSYQKRSGTGAVIMRLACRVQDGSHEECPTLR